MTQYESLTLFSPVSCRRCSTRLDYFFFPLLPNFFFPCITTRARFVVNQVQSLTIRKKMDATKLEFKVIISCILVSNTTPNQQTSVRLAMPLWMCIQHLKVSYYTQIEKLVCNLMRCNEFFNLMCRVIFLKNFVVLWKETST
jgi:hypothetical protein